MTLQKYFEERGIKFDQDSSGLRIKGSLHIDNRRYPLQLSGYYNLGIERRYVYLGNTAVSALPDNLTVEGVLSILGTGVNTLPNNLTVDRLNLIDTDITILPKNLTVRSDLNLNNTKIRTLSENISVGGILFIKDTAITTLPGSLKIGGIDLGGYVDQNWITSVPNCSCCDPTIIYHIKRNEVQCYDFKGTMDEFEWQVNFDKWEQPSDEAILHWAFRYQKECKEFIAFCRQHLAK